VRSAPVAFDPSPAGPAYPPIRPAASTSARPPLLSRTTHERTLLSRAGMRGVPRLPRPIRDRSPPPQDRRGRRRRDTVRRPSGHGPAIRATPASRRPSRRHCPVSPPHEPTSHRSRHGTPPPRPRQRSRRSRQATRWPGRVPRQPERGTQRPKSGTLAPEHVTRRPGRVTLAPGHVTRRPDRMTQAPGRVTQASGHMTRRPGRVTQSLGRVTQSIGRVARPPGRVSQADVRVTQRLRHTRTAAVFSRRPGASEVARRPADRPRAIGHGAQPSTSPTVATTRSIVPVGRKLPSSPKHSASSIRLDRPSHGVNTMKARRLDRARPVRRSEPALSPPSPRGATRCHEHHQQIGLVHRPAAVKVRRAVPRPCRVLGPV